MRLCLRESGSPSSVELSFEGSDGTRSTLLAAIDDQRTLSECLFGVRDEAHPLHEQLAGCDREALVVEIVGSVGFHAHAWESLALPGQDSSLAQSCAAFYRIIGDAVRPTIPESPSEDSCLELLCLVGSRCTPAVLPTLARLAEAGPALRVDVLVDPDQDAIRHALTSNPRIRSVHVDTRATLSETGIELWFDPAGGTIPLGLDDLLAMTAGTDARLVALALSWDNLPVQTLSASLASAQSRFRETTLVARGGQVGAWQRAMDTAGLHRILSIGSRVDDAVASLRKLGADNDDSAMLPPMMQFGYGDFAFVAEPAQSSIELAMQTPISKLRSRMHGFQSAMLPPEHMNPGSGAFVHALRQAPDSRSMVLVGDSGIGKTHLAHQIALAHCLRHPASQAFYFDFGEGPYTVSEMLGMIAPVVQAEDGRMEIVDALASHPCCFVLDGFPDFFDASDDAENCSEMRAFLERLSAVHTLIFVDNSPLPATRIPLPVASIQDLRLIAHEQLVRLGKAERPSHAQIDMLIQRSRANPWLLEKAIARLMTRSAEDVGSELSGLDDDAQDGLKTRYYDHQFAGLPQGWQRLLVLMNAFPGLFFELLAVAPAKSGDHAVSVTPTSALLRTLGQPSGSLSQAINALESAGFLERTGLGRLISISARRYLAAHAHEVPEADRIALCHCLCDALCTVAPQVQQTQHQMLAFNLVANRRHWARALEVLWNARMYAPFFATREQLQSLLAMYRLQSELDEWSHDLARRSVVQLDAPSIHPEFPLAWLTLARTSLASEARAGDPAIRDAASVLEARLFAFEASRLLDPPEQALFGQTVNFLEGFHVALRQWEDCYRVSAHALVLAEGLNLNNRVIRCLKSMAKCASMLGRFEESHPLEERMLAMIFLPDLEVPPRTQLMLALECVDERIARGAHEHAGSLLHGLRQSNAEATLAPLFERYDADLLLARGEVAAALESYTAIQRVHGPNGVGMAGAAHVEGRIRQLRAQLDGTAIEHDVQSRDPDLRATLH